MTVDLKSARHVRSVKLSFQNSQKPRRVYVSVGDGSTWQSMGLIRPQEAYVTAPWFDVTLPAPLTGRYVKIDFEIDGDWGWYINEVKVLGY